MELHVVVDFFDRVLGVQSKLRIAYLLEFISEISYQSLILISLRLIRTQYL